MNTIRILSLDPGYDRCGVAILEKPSTGKEVVLFSDCLTTDAKQDFPTRLGTLGKELHTLIGTYHPNALALERLYFNTNQKTAMMVAEVRGMVLYLANEACVPIFEYTPQQIKVAVTGSGRSDKKAVMLMVPKLVRIEKEIRLDDEYDAIAVGLCCSASERDFTKKHAPGKPPSAP